MSRSGQLQQRWYQDRPPPLWTRPVAALFGVLAGLRRRLYRHGLRRVTRLPVPVIVVGNLSVGGAGKTPVVIALVQALGQRGFHPGVVSRGYGGTASSPRPLAPDPDPGEVGDEPALIHARTGVPVAVGADRPAAARLLPARGVDVIISDDGLQHYALARDVEICVVDGVRRFGNARLLPAGPLREPLWRLGQVDFVVCNGGEPQAGEVPMQLALRAAEAVADRARTRPLAGFAGTRVHAVAGIGNPERFFGALRAQGLEVIAHAFADHHRYTPSDFAFTEDVPVLMTEKDAVKCRRFAQPEWWCVPVDAMLPGSFFDAVAGAIAANAPA